MINKNSTKEEVLEAVKKYGWLINYASDRLKDDKEVVLEAVKKDGYYLRYASDRLKNNKEVVFEAVKEGIYSIDYASDKIQILVGEDYFNAINILEDAIEKEKLAEKLTIELTEKDDIIIKKVKI